MKTRCGKLAMTFVLGAVCAGVATGSALAEEEKPTADLTVGAYSDYVWRGWILSDDSIVIQPSMTVGYKGFSFNLWGNLDTDLSEELGGQGEAKWNETDMTISYGGSAGMVGYSLGYIYYALDGTADTQEIYGDITVDTLLSPTLAVYRDIDSFEGWYITLAVSHSIAMTDTISLDLGAKAGYYDLDDGYSALHDGTLSASVSFAVNDYISITPELYYSFPLSNDAEDEFKASNPGGDEDVIYGGVSANFSF